MRLVAAILAATFATLGVARSVDAFVVPTWGAETPEIVGEFAVSGTNPNGYPEPEMTAVVKRVGAGLYRIRETGGSVDVDLVCIRTELHLGCAWGRKGLTLTIASYRERGRSLEGKVLATTEPIAFDVERYPLPTPMVAGIPGDYASTYAATSLGVPYDAKLVLRAQHAPSIFLAHLQRSPLSPGDAIGPIARFGLALWTGEFLDVATGPDVGVVEYAIDSGGAVLHGLWIGPDSFRDGTGSEILTRE